VISVRISRAYPDWGLLLMIYALTGSLALATDSGRNAGLPFAAPLRALAHNARFAWALPALGAWMVPVAAG
jgi:hypothetical protein